MFLGQRHRGVDIGRAQVQGHRCATDRYWRERAARQRSPLRALEQQLLAVSDTLSSRQGRSVTAMIAAADPDGVDAASVRGLVKQVVRGLAPA